MAGVGAGGEIFWVAPILANYSPLQPNPFWHSRELLKVAGIKLQISDY